MASFTRSSDRIHAAAPMTTRSTTAATPARRVALALVTIVMAGAAGMAFAQATTSAAPSTATGAAMPMGSGPGYHDPRSPFKPLQEVEGVVSWKLLSSVTVKADKSKIIPSFPSGVLALNQRTVKVQGFMMPLEPGDKQSHFLLSSVPTSCSFCVPAGPEGLVEVRSKTPVRYTLDVVTVEGQLAVLNDDPYGMFYRVTDAVRATR